MMVKRFNVGCVQSDAVSLIYSICGNGRLDEIAAIYDSGIGLPIVADVPDLATLRAATVPPGYAATCVAEGLFRLGARPHGWVTLDATGDDLGDSIVQDELHIAGAVTAERRAEMRAHGVLLSSSGYDRRRRVEPTDAARLVALLA